jgi:hypothetical protein
MRDGIRHPWASLRRGRTGRGRGYTGGSLNRRTWSRETVILRRSSCPIFEVSAWRQCSVLKPQAITRRRLPEREFTSSPSRSLYRLKGYHPEWSSKSAADKPRDHLPANQLHVGFDEPTSSCVECLAAVQRVFALCHRRAFRNALTLARTRISSCAASNRPIQMMSGK